MATPQGNPSRPKLRINTSQATTSKFPSARKIAMVDPKDPTALNTLSNVYASIIDHNHRTAIQPDPVTAININTRQPFQAANGDQRHPQAHTPYAAHGPTLPDTPLTAHPKSPMNNPEFVFPSALMTATPPLSAGAVDNNAPTFTFTPADMSRKLTLNTNIPKPVNYEAPRTPQQARQLPAMTTPPNNPPYTHPRTLHSILRNSPLPPSTARVAASPRRQSVRLQQKAAKRVGYNNPLTQTIVNSKYVFSHVDLLAEDASPSPMSPTEREQDMASLDAEMASMEGNTRDGGMTPGPLEDMRRKMAGLGASSPLTESGGVKKRRRREKKRQWAWTINTDEDPDDEVGGAIAAIRAAAERAKKNPDAPDTAVYLQPAAYIPDSTPSLCSQDSGAESQDVDMSDSSSLLSENSSRAATPNGMDLDAGASLGAASGSWPVVLGSEGFDEREEPSRVRKDTPMPPDLVVA